MSYRYDVLGLGIASLDFVGVAAAEAQLGAKQPLAAWIEAHGGPVATALVVLARFGMRCCMAGAVGDDGYGERIIADLRSEGIATEGMQIYPGGSHVAFVLAEPGSGRRSIWWHNDRTVLDRTALNRDLIASARALHIDTHMPGPALCAARLMHKTGGLVMIDAERVSDGALDLLPLCDVQIVSERFGREATGHTDPASAARALNARFGGVSVVTAGERGSWCATPDDFFHTRAFPVEAVDTTGAGDVFHGAFLYGLLSDLPLRETARLAAATAALKCRAPGGRAGIPTLTEVRTLINTNRNE